MVYSTAEDQLFALDAASGEPLWEKAAGPPFAMGFATTPILTEGVAFFLSQIGEMDAIDAATGERLWRYDAFPARVRSSPLLAQDKIYVDSPNGFVVALDAASGEVIQQYATSGLQVVNIAVSGSILYALSDSQQLYALDVESAELLWRRNAAGWSFSSLAGDGRNRLRQLL